MQSFLRIIKPPADIIITLILWLYFTLGYLFLFFPILLILYPFVRANEYLIQRINHYFFYFFFFMLKKINPGLKIEIGEDVKKINSSIIISNHISYLDPIMLISMYPRHKTIVKGVFFKIPIMRWIMKSGGYIPFTQGSEYHDIMLDSVQKLPAFFKAGGNLFIFPEGKRSRDGRLGKFQKGAFRLASSNKIPLELLYIQNSDTLFKPGKFFFNTCISNVISVERLGTILPEGLSVQELRIKAIELFNNKMKKIF